MEAIFELIGALVAALVELLLALAEVVGALVAMVLEFVFLALTQGVKAASGRFQQRQETRREKVATRKREASRRAAAKNVPVDPTGRWTIVLLVSIVLFAVVPPVLLLVGLKYGRERRIAQTKSQIEALADQYAEQVRDEDAADPEEGLLDDRDAWRQPIELQVDKSLLGTLIVVRSTGPDRKPGTIDDQLAIRTVGAPAKQIGGDLAKRGFEKLREKAKGWLRGDGEEEVGKVDEEQVRDDAAGRG